MQKEKNIDINFGLLFLGLSLISFGSLLFSAKMGWIDVFFVNPNFFIPMVIVFFGLSLLRFRCWSGVIVSTLITVLSVSAFLLLSVFIVCF